jgi:hypothetical protein
VYNALMRLYCFTLLWKDKHTGVDPMTNLFVATGDAIASLTQHGDEWTVARLLTGGMQCLALDPRHPATLYAGSYGRGIWKSHNSGAHWYQLELPQPNVFAVAVSPVDGAVYAGCEPSMLFRSADGGATWHELAARAALRTHLELSAAPLDVARTLGRAQPARRRDPAGWD